MDATTLQTRLVALRADDGVLEQRLAQLDAKLSAWLAAVQAGRAALLELARRVVPSARFCEPADEAANAAAAQEQAADQAADEALLQTLDPATANAVRIKRRLTRGTRSVRELLDELRAAHAQTETQPQSNRSERRGWWRRSNG